MIPGMNPPLPRPAEMLSGLELEAGWVVGSRAKRIQQGTGGMFSVCYNVTNSMDGRKGFLKALDFTGAFEDDDPSRRLQEITEAFNFERDVLAACRGHAMDRIITSIADGKVTVPHATAGGVVVYLIFELADGDIRTHLSSNSANLAWRLRCLHHIATGLKQLHGVGIAHQDVKPSNVLVFDGQKSKVGDLGRAARKGFTPPHEDFSFAGDSGYAPPERLYNFDDGEWNSRRQGCDCYLLGSMVAFFFCGVSFTQLLFDRMAPEHHWTVWGGSFEDVLPYLRQAFNEVIEEFSNQIQNRSLRQEIVYILRQMCDPDPRYRGDNLNRGRGGNPFNLERYLTKLDVLSRRAARGDYEEVIS